MDKFEQWLQAKGFDPATVTETQKTSLRASYDAELKASGQGSPTFSKIDEEIAEGRRQTAIEDMTASAVRALPNSEKAVQGESLKALCEKAIKDKWTVQAFDTELLRAKRPPWIPPTGRETSYDKGKALEAATLLSCGFREDAVAKMYGDQNISAARTNYPAMGLKDLVRYCARANGYQGNDSATGSNLDELVRWGKAPQIQATGFSTVDLSGILGNVANKAIAAESISPIWLAPQLAGVASHSNFHSHTVYSAIQTATMEKVGPTGEIKHADMSEESYTRQLYTYAQILRVSRTDVVNDDLGVFASRARTMVEAAFKTRELALFTKIMVSGAGSTHFTAARGNYVSGATSALSITGLNLAIAAFRNLKGPDGSPMMIEPSILLIPPTLEATGRELLTAGSSKFTRTGETLGTAIFQSDANVFAGRFGGAPLVSPYLEWSAITGSSAAYWYMFADPQRYPCYEVSYLNGQQAPTVTNYGIDSDPDTLGIAWRIFWDFGVDTALWRAGVKVAGA